MTTQYFAKIFLSLSAVVLMSGCVPSVNQISGRNPDLFDKETDHLHLRGRPVGELRAPEIYVKQKSVSIRPASLPNESGSLFNPDDERNYLFTAASPLNVGRFLTVNVVSNAQTSPGKQNSESQKPESKLEAKDETESELLKSLPDLTPATAGDPTLQKSFKMKVVHRFENGDVLAMTNRRSTANGAGNDITIESRIPYARLATGDALTTEDLADVHYTEASDGEIIDRYSSGWEDEYSLRMSGFDEAKSKIAMEIDDKVKKLEEARVKLETQMKTFGEERRKVAKLREDTSKKSQAMDSEREVLEGKVEDQEETISKQKQELDDKEKEIEELKKIEDKPGDKKDGG